MQTTKTDRTGHLSSLGTQSFCWFYHEAAQMYKVLSVSCQLTDESFNPSYSL